MRDPARIQPLLDLIREKWTVAPDLRFGQLLVAVTQSKEWFYLEDDKLMERLAEFNVTKYHFKSELSRRLTQIQNRAFEVFESNDAAMDFLHRTRSTAFNGKRAIEMIFSDEDTEKVLAHLGRIEHGVFG